MWLKTSLLLCSYGFFKEFRPSEPFLTEYLLGPYHNLTENQVYYDVYPVWTYSYLSLLVVVFLVTDLLRYKPVVIFEAVGYVATWCLLLWARGVHWMQMMEFCYGIATSTEVAYYTYIYAQVDGKHYQKVTSYTRTAILIGRFFSSVSGQVLASTGLMDYHSLNYISLASVSVALVIAVCLPSVKTSIYFHRNSFLEAKTKNVENNASMDKVTDHEPKTSVHYSKKERNAFSLVSLKKVVRLLSRDFKDAYTNKYILKWSVWWSMATCINYQIGNYIQPLWESILPYEDADSLYNGAVDAASTLLGALAAFSIGYVNLNWAIVGEITLAIITLLNALILLFMGLTSHIWVAYIGYTVFRSTYQVLITVASFQVAKELRAESYGLIFGLNMFVALLLQTIMTLIVEEWLEIELGMQFVIYGCYFFVLSFMFFVLAFFTLRSICIQGFEVKDIWLSDTESSDRKTPKQISNES